jgi:hypothetical protein
MLESIGATSPATTRPFPLAVCSNLLTRVVFSFTYSAIALRRSSKDECDGKHSYGYYCLSLSSCSHLARLPGAGYENVANYPFATLSFLGLPNIHTMRDSFSKLLLYACPQTRYIIELISSSNENRALQQSTDWDGETNSNWLQLLERSEWFVYLRLVLWGAGRIAATLHTVWSYSS